MPPPVPHNHPLWLGLHLQHSWGLISMGTHGVPLFCLRFSLWQFGAFLLQLPRLA